MTAPSATAPSATVSSSEPTSPFASPPAAGDTQLVDLRRRRDELAGRVAELQWDLGGLAYEMAIRNHVRIDVLVRQAMGLQEADRELCEVERLLRTEQTGTAGLCANCQAPHSGGAGYCWQCGRPLLQQVPGHVIGL